MNLEENPPRRRVAIELPDGPATVFCFPGVPEPGPGHQAIFTATRRTTARQVFVAGPGASATALWAARSGAKIIHWTDSAAEAGSLAATFRANDLNPPTSHVAPDCAALLPGQSDVALLHLPRGRELQRAYLGTAAAMVQEGDTIFFVGAKKEGVKSALADAQEIFGRAGIVARKGGYHAGMAYRPARDLTVPTAKFRTHEIIVEGRPTQLVTCPGAFAADRLDDGAAALIAGMRIQPNAQVLDLGCGTGLVALEAARREGNVQGTDVSARAVASARRTLRANGYPDVAVHLCNGAAAIQTGTMDVVATNPPFHRGHDIDFDVSQYFVAEAARVLKPGGRVYLVANTFLDYGQWLPSYFRDVETVWHDKRFRVWSGQKKLR